MTELEMFAKSIIEDGNQWWELEKSDKGGLYMSKKVYSDGRNDYYGTPMYQVFNSEGKRIGVTPIYNDALAKYRRL